MEINEASPKFREESIAPMHTAEHLLNATMDRMFGCGRAVSAHIERKKSKCDYLLPEEPTAAMLQNIETAMNEVIAAAVPVTFEYITHTEAEKRFDLSRLPESASDTLRIVCIGDYDACPCVGAHVGNTKEIGIFSIISHDYSDGRLRLRFKINK